METPLTLLYTANIRGNLALLPRLHTFIKDLKRNAPGKTHVIDLGRSCVPDVWPCDITEGRAGLIALDAMGYTAANVTNVLAQGVREKLAGQVMLGLVDADHPYQHDGVVYAVDGHTPDDAPPDALHVVMAPDESTVYAENRLQLADVVTGEVGLLTLDGDTLQAATHRMPADTAPDPTIAGAVDFIESEARYYERRGKARGQ